MLEIRRTAIALDEQELQQLEWVIMDKDEKGSLRFLRKIIYDKVAHSQCHCEVYYARN